MKRGPKVINLPWTPIAPHITTEPAGSSGRYNGHQPGPHNWYGIRALERSSGIPAGTWHRWKRTGVPLASADRVANALGFDHPVFLWGPDYTNAVDRYHELMPDNRVAISSRDQMYRRRAKERRAAA